MSSSEYETEGLECALIAAVLMNRGSGVEVISTVPATAFSSEAHRRIWECIRTIEDCGDAPDLELVVAKLRERQWLSVVGGASYLSSLLDTVADVTNVRSYALRLVEAHQRRTVATAAQRLTLALEAGVDVRVALAAFDSATQQETGTDGLERLEDVVGRRVGQLIAERNGEAAGLGTGPLRDVLNPLKPGCVYVVGGTPGAGKSVLCDQLAYGAGSESVVVIFTLEMTNDQRVDRYLAGAANVPARNITFSTFSRDQVASLERVAGGRHQAVWFDQTRGLTVGDLRARCKRVRAQCGRLDLVVVDYLQLMDAGTRGRSREQEVAEMSTGITRLAGELKVPVILASQLSRTHEQERRAPELRDLRESGRIEQDAHAVVLLWKVESGTDAVQVVARVRKQRDGGLGEVALTLDKRSLRFGAA